jgi:5-methylthioadenosine/S-adenosylhomocysteine deaminase
MEVFMFRIAWVLMGALCSCLFASATWARQSQTSVDMMVYGDYVVTMNTEAPVIRNGAVAVMDGQIIAVGTEAEIERQYSASTVVSGVGRILMPGLVNGHTHSAMVLFRGMADDLPLMEWLQNYIFPMEGRYVDEALIDAGTRLACWEMISSGTTTFVDMYFYPDVIAKVVEECGLRAVIAAPMIDFPSPGFQGWDDSFAAGVSFAERWKGKHPRITPALAPHAPYTVSKDHLAQAFQAAKELDVPISIHVAEDRAEVKMISDQYGQSSIKLLSGLGMLEQRTIAAHVVWPTDADIQALAGSKVGAIHNPTSNMKTGAGVSPVPKMLAADVSVGLGTDGAASNNDLDLWQDMRLAALLHKGVSGDPTVVSAEQALAMATRMGAQAIGLGDKVGALKKGTRADMIQVSYESARFDPMYNVISQLVYVATSKDVVTSIVEGKLLMENRVVTTIDLEKVRADVSVIADQIRRDLQKGVKR